MEMKINENEIQPSNKQNFEQKAKEMIELESIVGTVTYSLPVALIKISILNDYTPLEIEKYYELVLPALPMLKRTDGTKYTTNNIKTIRSAMVSDQLFFKNDDGLYELNVPNALEHIKVMQKRKLIDDKILNEKKMNKLNKKMEKEKKKNEIKNKKKFHKLLNRKRLAELDQDYREYKKYKKNKIHKPISFGKYGDAYTLFNNLLKISEENENISPKLRLDLDAFSALHLDDDNYYNNKVIGMLTAFKFFKPFLEKNFNSRKIQQKIIEKLSDLNNEIGHMNNIIKSDDY